MIILFNAPKIAFYAGLLTLSIWGGLPWWALPMTVLYDTVYMVVWKVPWTKFPPPGPLQPEGEEISLQQILQFRALMEKQNGEVTH